MKYCKPLIAMFSAAAIAVAVPLYAPCDSPSDVPVTITATAVTPAAIPTIDGPDQVDVGKPAWYRVAGVPDGASVAFLPTPLLDTSPGRIVQGNAMFWVGSPGEYTITALVVDWTAHTFVPIVKQITAAGVNPPIPPVPPVPGDRWVVIVSETNRPTVEHRQLLTELRTSNQFPRLWIVDPDPARADPAVAPYLSGLDAAKPQIIIIGEDATGDGVVLYRGDCPTTAADVAALLKRYGG